MQITRNAVSLTFREIWSRYVWMSRFGDFFASFSGYSAWNFPNIPGGLDLSGTHIVVACLVVIAWVPWREDTIKQHNSVKRCVNYVNMTFDGFT